MLQTPVFRVAVESLVATIFILFPSFITSLDLPINLLELLTIVVPAKLWGSDWKGLHILARCDNLIAIMVINTGRSRDRFLNSCLHELCYLADTFEFELRRTQHSAYAAGTYSNLRTQFRTFFLFCSYFNFRPIPAMLDTVCLYA